MNNTVSLKENRHFKRLYARGKNAATPYLAAYCRPNRQKVNRLGLTVSTKLGGAVRRNRIRRRMHEAYRLQEGRFSVGYDIVVVARTRAIDAEFEVLCRSMVELFGRLGLLQRTPAAGDGEDEKAFARSH